MFGLLHALILCLYIYLYQEEFYNNHQIITFETLDKKTEFQIFAVFKTTAYSDNSFKYYEYINFQNINDYDNYIKNKKN